MNGRIPMPPKTAALALCVVAALLAGCHRASVPDRQNFTAALKDYLVQRGRFCMSKYDWPIVVSDAEFQAGGRNSVQMPALEKLGVVSHEDVVGTTKDEQGRDQSIHGLRYSLTPAGRKYYVRMPVVVQSNAINRVTHPADFCPATLSLNQLVGWERPQTHDGRTRTAVTYTYHIDPAPWARTPEARRAFPMLERVIAGEGTLQLKEGMTLTPKGWVADELLP